MKRFKKTFKLHHLLLTSTFVATTENIAKVLEIPALSQHLDFVHFVQKYNFNWKPQGDIVSYAMRLRGIGNTQQMIDGLIEHGVAPDKLVLGLQFAGQLFRSIQDLDRFYEPTYTQSLAYCEICDALTTSIGWQKTYDIESGLTIAKRFEVPSNAFLPQMLTILYESGRSIARKVQFALRRNIAGVMVFPIDMDDFIGKCTFERDTFADFVPKKGVNLNIETRENKKFPLLKTVNEAIVAPLEMVQLKNTITNRRIVPIIPIASATIDLPNGLRLPDVHNSHIFTSNDRIFKPNTNVRQSQKGNAATNVNVIKFRRPIQNVKTPFKRTYDDYDLDILDTLLTL